MSDAAVAIVPAHNEGPRVGAVVRALVAADVFTEVVVVDDGSTDDTAQQAAAAGARVLSLKPNQGKGAALRAGVRATTAPLVGFFDADLAGFAPAHAQALVAAVRDGCGMACGLRDYGPWYNVLQAALPPITGERVVRRALLAGVPDDFWAGWRIEAGINAAVQAAGARTCLVQLTGIVTPPKWAKGGDPGQGLVDATQMIIEVLHAMADAQNQIRPAGAPTAVPAASAPPVKPAAGCACLNPVLPIRYLHSARELNGPFAVQARLRGA